RRTPVELVLAGEVDDWEKDVLEELLKAPPGGECVFYIDSSGGSVYGALAVVALMRHRRLQGRAVVLAECSSAALLLFASCPRGSACLCPGRGGATERTRRPAAPVTGARHFETLEREMDELLIRLLGKADEQVRTWIKEDRYVTGEELVAAGLAELLEIG